MTKLLLKYGACVNASTCFGESVIDMIELSDLTEELKNSIVDILVKCGGKRRKPYEPFIGSGVKEEWYYNHLGYKLE